MQQLSSQSKLSASFEFQTNPSARNSFKILIANNTPLLAICDCDALLRREGNKRCEIVKLIIHPGEASGCGEQKFQAMSLTSEYLAKESCLARIRGHRQQCTSDAHEAFCPRIYFLQPAALHPIQSLPASLVHHIPPISAALFFSILLLHSSVRFFFALIDVLFSSSKRIAFS